MAGQLWQDVYPLLVSDRYVIVERALTDVAAATPVFPEKQPSQARLRGATTLVAAPRFAAPKIA